MEAFQQMTDDKKITLIIIDDHPMVRDGLEIMLASRRIFKIVKTLASGQEAVAYIRGHGAPDVIISDVRMQGMDGFETLAKIKRFYPDARVLLLAGMPTMEEVERARKACAAGYMSKSARIEQLSDAVQEIAHDPSFFAEDSFVPEPRILSPRETDVLRLIAAGLSREQIAAKLCVSPETVKSRVKTLMIKLDVSNSAGAVHRGHELGILHA